VLGALFGLKLEGVKTPKAFLFDNLQFKLNQQRKALVPAFTIRHGAFTI